jgi:hypothetical protein
MFTFIRWHIFKILSEIGWRICPKPHRSRLQQVMPQWEDLEPQLAAVIEREFFDPAGKDGRGSDFPFAGR